MVFKSFSIERRLMKQYQEHSENITSEELKRGRIEELPAHSRRF